jgi:hypothetical protein
MTEEPPRPPLAFIRPVTRVSEFLRMRPAPPTERG